MKNKFISHLLMRTFWLSLLLPLTLTGGCASSDVEKFEWTEEVKLADGRVIVVRVGAEFALGTFFNHASISADLPAPVSRKVEWKGNRITPFILDISPEGTVYLVCAVGSSGEARQIWKVPMHENFVSFQLEGDHWKVIPLSDLPPMIKRANFLGFVHTVFKPQREHLPKHFDLKTKERLVAQFGTDLIDREIVRGKAPPSQ